MAALGQSHAQLARSMHPKLLKFFARYPPEAVSPKPSQLGGSTSNTPSSDANQALAEPPRGPATLGPCQNNPFLPMKSSVSGAWMGPRYSLRQQADLWKLAERHGLKELLPYTPKSLDERTRKREELGLRVKGTGVGQNVKGHIFERFMHQRQEKQKTAMKRMPGLIRFWRLRNRSRGWKAWPKSGR